VLGLVYETRPDTIRAIVAELRARLNADAMVDPTTVLVHFTAFGASSLDVDIKVVFRTTDFAEYRAAVERFNLDCIAIVARHGSGFAFPSRTVYVVGEDGQRTEVRQTAAAAGG
jgi:MscS family membrane protein